MLEVKIKSNNNDSNINENTQISYKEDNQIPYPEISQNYLNQNDILNQENKRISSDNNPELNINQNILTRQDSMTYFKDNNRNNDNLYYFSDRNHPPIKFKIYNNQIQKRLFNSQKQDINTNENYLINNNINTINTEVSNDLMNNQPISNITETNLNNPLPYISPVVIQNFEKNDKNSEISNNTSIPLRKHRRRNCSCDCDCDCDCNCDTCCYYFCIGCCTGCIAALRSIY